MSDVATNMPRGLEQQHPAKGKTGNVILIGLPACGKTLIGLELAKLLGLGLLDLDDWIERSTGQSIGEIFESFGEEGFRRLESQALSKLLNIRSHVISVGSGSIMAPENWSILKQLGVIAYIDCPIHVIAKRLVNRPSQLEKRPLMKDLISIEDGSERLKSIENRLQELQEMRLPRFQDAQVVVTNHTGTAGFIAQCLAREISEFYLQRKI